MFDLNPRQRAALLAGLELLHKQAATRRGAAAGGAPLSADGIAALASIIRGDKAVAAVHQHAADGARKRSHNVVGECGVHGTICLACEIVWHLEDGSLDWCRECDRALAEHDEPAKLAATKRRRTSPR
jgi:hypothetical protein